MKTICALILLLLTVSVYAQKAPNVTDAKGLKQGYWEKLNPSTGRVAYRGTFKDNKPVGTFKYYYEEIDTIRTMMQFTSRPGVAYATMYFMTGKMQAKGKYVNEKKDSTWNFYDEAGQLLSQETYKDGKRNGKSVVFYQNGDISEERSYKMDVEDGVFKQYFEGKKVKGEGTYENGKLVGKNAYYYPNGTSAAIGYYNKQGNKNGLWLYKDAEGKVTSKDVYDNGELLTGKKADEFLAKNKAKLEEEQKEKPKTPGGKTPPKSGGKTGGKK
jgi:antitoxin component YwqK of YwqJK toxin-antitoxin module